MNKKLIVIVGVLVLIAAAVGYLLLASPKSEKAFPQNLTETMQDDALAEQPRAPSSQAGTYVEYTEGIVAKTEGTKVLFFHAPWCPQCRDLEDDITSNKIPEGVTIIKVDYDSASALKEKYGVTLQTTLVLVDDEGNGIKKFVAYDDPSLAALKKNLL